jgi:hypothetical protein
MDSLVLLTLKRRREQKTHVEKQLAELVPTLFKRTIILFKRTTLTRIRRSHRKRRTKQRLNTQPHLRRRRETAIYARVRTTLLGSVRFARA